MTANVQGDRETLLTVLNGDKGWEVTNGKVKKLTALHLSETKQRLYRDWLLTLVPLLRDEGFGLTALGENKDGGEALVGVKVTYKGFKEVRLYFDNKSKLLKKTESELLDVDGKPTPLKNIFLDYQKKGGIQYPCRQIAYMDGKKVGEGELTDLDFPEKFPAAFFEKPK